MIPNDHTFGFRIRGSTADPRTPIHYERALRAYAECDPLANVDEEGYLSHFTFPQEFVSHVEGTGSVAEYTGSCWTPILQWDIDREDDLALGLKETRRLCLAIDVRFGLTSDSDMLIAFSGRKGFSVGVPTALWSPPPSADFNRVARRFAACFAERAGVGVYDASRGYRVDEGIYDRVRPFRAPNSRHPKTGLHKCRLSFDELMGMSVDQIVKLARHPEPFDLPEPIYRSEQAAADWREAEEWVEREAEERAARQQTRAGMPTLNRATREFIAEGAAKGDRHRLLYSAAKNIAEFPSVEALAYALLTESALNSGLPPKDVERGIHCGLAGAPLCTPEPQRSTEELQAQLKDMWDEPVTAPPTASPIPATEKFATSAPPVPSPPWEAEWRAERDLLAQRVSACPDADLRQRLESLHGEEPRSCGEWTSLAVRIRDAAAAWERLRDPTTGKEAV